MNKDTIQSLMGSIIAVLIAVGLALAGSQHSITVMQGIPLYALCVAIAFVIQWGAFIPSYFARTEKYYDLIGSLTYTTVILVALIMTSRYDSQSILLAVLVLIWTFRLGFYLFRRILRTGKDKRFNEIKKSASRFFLAWTLQGLWVSFTAAAALAAITHEKTVELGIVSIIGICVWVIGFSFEVIADLQKSKFAQNPANRDKFITVGLWSVSRHPNYFGEIVIWIGIAIIAFPSLQGWGYLTLISPIFVAMLITQISGVPLNERYADEKWGGQKDYEEYKKKTPVLIPKLPWI